MSEMTDALERIRAACGWNFTNRTSRTREYIERQLGFFPFYLANEACEFYQWPGAPTGLIYPEYWSPENDNSTYHCALEELLGTGADVIHFASLEEAEMSYDPLNVEPEMLPFVFYENGLLSIMGSTTRAETSPVIQREDLNSLWFPSLTNMMLAIAESLETVGAILPGLSVNYLGDEDCGTETYRERTRSQCETVKAIALKYGSPRGIIVTN